MDPFAGREQFRSSESVELRYSHLLWLVSQTPPRLASFPCKFSSSHASDLSPEPIIGNVGSSSRGSVLDVLWHRPSSDCPTQTRPAPLSSVRSGHCSPCDGSFYFQPGGVGTSYPPESLVIQYTGESKQSSSARRGPKRSMICQGSKCESLGPVIFRHRDGKFEGSGHCN